MGFPIAASLSARRAWIEIKAHALSVTGSEVALRKESVDRNYKEVTQHMQAILSLSARRAWIEIVIGVVVVYQLVVALRKESVDRNTISMGSLDHSPRRSPQGERG